jgi:AcrR family transcriptional regulator
MTASEDNRGRRGRSRNAALTRQEILRAAQMHFTRYGYDGVGVRDIAATVGVNAALVIRYFGSKEELFAESVADAFEFPFDEVLNDHSKVGELLARGILEKEEEVGEDEFDPLLVLLRSAANARAAGILREVLDEQFIQPLARRLGGEDAELRAALIAAYMLGLAFMRLVMRSGPLAAGETERLIAFVAPVLQSYVDGPPS